LPIKKALRLIFGISKKRKINTPDAALYALEREAVNTIGEGSVLSERKRLLLDKLVKRKRKQLASRTKAVNRGGPSSALHGPYSN